MSYCPSPMSRHLDGIREAEYMHSQMSISPTNRDIVLATCVSRCVMIPCLTSIQSKGPLHH